MKKALEYFEKKIAEYKKFTLPLLAIFVEMDRGAILMQNHRSAEAFQSLAALQKQMTPPFDKFVNIGYIETYLLQKKADEAEKYLPDIQTLITQTGTKVLQSYVLRTQGKIAEIRGNYGQAIAYYLELIKQSPGVLTTNHSLAVCYRFLKEYDKAEEALKKALLISPFSAVLNREAAQLYWDMGKKAEALNYLKKAAMIWQEADPDYEPALKVREQLQAWTN
jgi:tetratricopeptide (TPR) repeat protein